MMTMVLVRNPLRMLEPGRSASPSEYQPAHDDDDDDDDDDCGDGGGHGHDGDDGDQ